MSAAFFPAGATVREWMVEHGLNLTILWDPADGRRFALGLLLTLALAGLSIVLSLAIGVAGAALKGSRLAPVRKAVAAYVEVFRNTPLLAQMYFFFFGIGSLLPMVVNEQGEQVRLLGGFGWAVIVLGLHSGAFQIEALRASIDAVPRSTVEAAEALGLSRLQIFRQVVGPLALRNSLPALSNSIAQTIKATSVAFAIAVPELTYACNRIWSDSFNVPVMIQILLVTYLLLIGGVSALMRTIERRLQMPGVQPA
jgi:polar amino acid transport system permease protein